MHAHTRTQSFRNLCLGDSFSDLLSLLNWEMKVFLKYEIVHKTRRLQGETEEGKGRNGRIRGRRGGRN